MLLAAQWLAVVHSVSGHGQGRPAPSVAHRSAGVVGAIQAVVAAHDDGSLVCHALDHCLQGGHVGGDAPVMPAGLPAPGVPGPVVADVVSERLAAYLARAPPQTVPMLDA